jgi:hypothetical protein
MGRFARFEPIEGASRLNSVDQPLLDENIEVAIHVSQAQAGELGFQVIVYLARGGMVIGLPQKV